MAGVTGDSTDPTALAWRFSPESNDKRHVTHPDDELRVLVATDILSEGQNLQDAHVVVNFDLPWAIIRLIQRVGRVDRIGQKSSQILAYAFWPRAIRVDVAEVSRGPMAASIDEEGETRVKDVFTVSAPVSGEMDRVTLEPGDRVIKGSTKLTIIRPSSSAVLDQRTEAQLQAGVKTAISAISLAE